MLLPCHILARPNDARDSNRGAMDINQGAMDTNWGAMNMAGDGHSPAKGNSADSKSSRWPILVSTPKKNEVRF